MPKESRPKSISRKIRFEVFKRDGFKCVYCGKNPPQAILEVDHIDPKSLGGSGEINNLITSCFDCNRGKKNIPLDRIPPKLQENLEVLKEQEEQIKSYRKFIKKIERRENLDIETIAKIYTNSFNRWSLSDNFKRISLRKFIRSLPIEEVEDSLRIALSKFHHDKDKAILYFCGICWRKIKGVRPGWEEHGKN